MLCVLLSVASRKFTPNKKEKRSFSRKSHDNYLLELIFVDYFAKTISTANYVLLLDSLENDMQKNFPNGPTK